MRYTILAVVVAASLAGCESKKSSSEQPATQPPPGSAAQPTVGAQLTDLTTASTLAPVRTAFNARKGEARFLTLLAPTWAACIRGAREVRKTIVDDPKAASVAIIVAWIPMLDSDERVEAVAMTNTYADKPIPQFWDGERLLGMEVSRSLGIDPAKISWDIYLFYPPDAEWTDAGLPPPEKVIVQAMDVVIGAKGSLPPQGDQSRLPKWAEGRADVVGEQSDLAALLTAIVVPFAQRYQRGR